jgi:hypothetical protein
MGDVVGGVLAVRGRVLTLGPKVGAMPAGAGRVEP